MVATFLLRSGELTAHGAAGGVNLDFDATLLVQVVFILVLWAVLKPMLFDPLLKLFEEREKRIEGTKKRARRIDEESAEAKAKYDDLMNQARAEGTAEREKLRAESIRKESELLTKVRGEIQHTVDEARTETQREVDSTRTALKPHTQAIARELATRVLGREVS
jgi:F-type H+-transporting ATPase subunit b